MSRRVLDASPPDLGKPPVEAYFELVAVRAGAEAGPTAAAALEWRPATVSVADARLTIG